MAWWVSRGIALDAFKAEARSVHVDRDGCRHGWASTGHALLVPLANCFKSVWRQYTRAQGTKEIGLNLSENSQIQTIRGNFVP